MSQPLISVIIPTCHRNEDLARCLEALGPGRQEGMELLVNAEMLSAGAYAPPDGDATLRSPRQLTPTAGACGPHGCESPEGNRASDPSQHFCVSASQNYPSYEVIVSDDGRESTAEAMIRERFPWAKWVEGSKRGPAANRNCGAGSAQGDWLAFTDDDCIPDNVWLKGYRKVLLSHPEIRVFDGYVYSDPIESLCLGAPTSAGGNLWTCNLLVERRLFCEVSGFCEAFPYPCMEDVEFRIRIEKLGQSHYYEPSAAVYHPPRRIPNFIQHYIRSAKSTAKFLEIHPEQQSNFRLICSVKSLLYWNWKRIPIARCSLPRDVVRCGFQIILGQLAYLFLLHVWKQRAPLATAKTAEGARG